MKNIGVGGKTLKEMLEEDRRLYRETGYYHGLKDLPLTRQNPLKMEVLRTRLLASTVAGRETTRMISGSPLTREVAELAVALYTPEGDCLLQSTGIVIHMPLVGQVIKWMIDQGYEEDPGIEEGDCFTCNDNNIAGMHVFDIYDISPIFWDKELVGWVGTVIMEPELGSLPAGTGPTSSTNRFTDGLHFLAEKSAVKDIHVKSFERKIRSGCLFPDLILLDRKGALAANVSVKKEVHKIIDEFGLDYFLSAGKELIEAERRAQLERVKSRTVPGKFHFVNCFEVDMSKTLAAPHHAVDTMTLVPVGFHIKADGRYFLDFDGAGKWGWHPSNLTPSALTGAALLMLSQTLAYTGHANDGTIMSLDVNTPYDTFVNPSSPYISTAGLFAWPTQGGGLWMGAQSRAFFSRGFIEEVEAAPIGTTVICMAGTSHYGREYNFALPEMTGGHASGAFAIRDGVQSQVIWLPPSDMGNAEVWEHVAPVVWMGRKVMVDSFGWGQYRSGTSLLSTFMIYKTPALSFDLVSYPSNGKIYPSSGLYGGYPGQGNFRKLLTHCNTHELVEKRMPLAHGFKYPEKSDLEDNIKGELMVDVGTSGYIKKKASHGDWFQIGYGSNAGGFGDPIDRDPKLVKKDLDNGIVTSDRCRRIYCVEARYDEKSKEWVVDNEATAELRDRKRKERREKGLPFKNWWIRRRQDVLAGNMPQRVKEMYNGSLEKGTRWPGEFRGFWALPDDFTFKGGVTHD